ncbi:MBL fold metallo-hydrolase [Parabacteroides sp.]
MQKTELIILGTGNATVTRCYNTCFALKRNNDFLLVDAGGGNGILSQLEKVGIPYSGIHEIFVTHAHTDHILGIIWMIRIIAQQMNQGKYTGTLKVYGHDKVVTVLNTMCELMLPKKITVHINKDILFCELQHGDTFTAIGMNFQCFDIQSTKEKQYGFRTTLPNGKSLVCLGDEPYNETNRSFVEGADWMLCEAFCLYEDRERFKPYEKHHSTALDAGKLAQQLGIKNLLLYHTEDKTLATRKEKYGAEAKENFSGNVFVPEDLEVIAL